MKSFLTAGLALAACAALAGVTEQTFESAEVGTKPTGWTGDAAVVSSGDAERGNVLAVDGEAKCENDKAASASQWGKTTFLVKAPEDATAMGDLPTADVIGKNCQIAVATGEAITEGDDAGKLKVMVYQGTTAKWVEAQGVSVAKDAWFKVGLNFDYNDSKVQVLINDTAATTFFNLVTPLEEEVKTSKINSLSFVGSTKVDDVSIAEVDNVPVEALPADLQKLNVNLATLGVSIEAINSSATVGNSGLTVAQKIESGLNPTDDSKFTATALAPAADGKIAVTVPYAFNNGQKYTVVMTDETGAKTETTVEPVIDSVNKTATLTVTPGSGKVLKVQVKAGAPAAK